MSDEQVKVWRLDTTDRKIHDALVDAVSSFGAEYVTTKIDRQVKGARSIIVSVMPDKRKHKR